MADATRTLCYHLNRLANTLIGDIPQYDSQGAAQIWAKNNSVTPYNGIELVGVLNNLYASRHAGVNPHRDLQGILNALAGTTGYGENYAASLIAS
jgi:hypothetical protein